MLSGPQCTHRGRDGVPDPLVHRVAPRAEIAGPRRVGVQPERPGGDPDAQTKIEKELVTSPTREEPYAR